jgi:hypothetical protein
MARKRCTYAYLRLRFIVNVMMNPRVIVWLTITEIKTFKRKSCAPNKGAKCTQSLSEMNVNLTEGRLKKRRGKQRKLDMSSTKPHTREWTESPKPTTMCVGLEYLLQSTH